MASNYHRKMDRKYFNGDEERITRLLLGRKIVQARGKRILILDDHTLLIFYCNAGYGTDESGNYDIESIAAFDDVVTDVRFMESVDSGSKRYELFACSEENPEGLRILSVLGADVEGLYGTGYSVEVTFPA